MVHAGEGNTFQKLHLHKYCGTTKLQSKPLITTLKCHKKVIVITTNFYNRVRQKRLLLWKWFSAHIYKTEMSLYGQPHRLRLAFANRLHKAPRKDHLSHSRKPWLADCMLLKWYCRLPFWTFYFNLDLVGGVPPCFPYLLGQKTAGDKGAVGRLAWLHDRPHQRLLCAGRNCRNLFHVQSHAWSHIMHSTSYRSPNTTFTTLPQLVISLDFAAMRAAAV